MAVGGFNCEGLKVTSFDPNQARSQGGQWGQLHTSIPKVAPKNFRIIKLLMCKSKKYFTANQQNCGTCPYFNL